MQVGPEIIVARNCPYSSVEHLSMPATLQLKPGHTGLSHTLSFCPQTPLICTCNNHTRDFHKDAPKVQILKILSGSSKKLRKVGRCEEPPESPFEKRCGDQSRPRAARSTPSGTDTAPLLKELPTAVKTGNNFQSPARY